MTESLESRFWYLSDHSFFWEISNQDLKSLCVIMGFKKASKGDIIYLNDEEPRIYFLKRGALKIVRANDNGEELILEMISKGDLFGQLMKDGDPASRGDYAIALTNEVVICSFLAKDFEELMVRKPDLALKYTKILAFKYKRIANSYNNLFFRSAKARLATFLLEWAGREGRVESGKFILENYLTQNDLAQIICTTRQTGTSLINGFESEGFLSYSRKEIVIHQPEKLRKLIEM